MLLLSKEDIKKAFSMQDAIEANKLAFRLATEGTIDVPLRTVIGAPTEGGSFIFMPAYDASVRAASVKVVNIFPRNAEKGLMTAPGQILLCDGETGYITALLDGAYITQLRTGAASGAAFDLLAKKECRIGAMIGTGGQAAEQLEAMICARKLEEVRIFSRNRERCLAFCERMKEELASYGTRFVAAESADEAVDDADLLITVTSSKEPVFDGSKIKAGCTVSCVGGYLPDMCECDPALLPRASKIICDLKSAVLAEAGDLLIPLADGTITEDKIVGSLGEVVNGTLVGRENEEEIIVFKSVGIGAQDLIASKLVYDSARKNGFGTNWGE